MYGIATGTSSSQSVRRGGGDGIVLYALDGTNVSSFKLDFPYSNYNAGYEALVIALVSPLQMG